MTAFDYAGTRDDADALLQEFGAPSALRRVTNTGGTGFEPTQTTTDYPTVACVLNYTRRYPSYVQNSDVLITDRRGLVSAGPLNALGVTGITPFDTLVFGTTVYKIIDAKPIAPAGVPVLYDLQLRV